MGRLLQDASKKRVNTSVKRSLTDTTLISYSNQICTKSVYLFQIRYRQFKQFGDRIQRVPIFDSIVHLLWRIALANRDNKLLLKRQSIRTKVVKIFDFESNAEFLRALEFTENLRGRIDEN